MGRMVLILGGARSGKSHFAQQLAQQLAGDDVLLVATATAHDEEMRERIGRHRASRPASWQLLEAPRNVAAELWRCAGKVRVVLIDCLTLLISNILVAAPAGDAAGEQLVAAEIDALLQFGATYPGVVLLVSNEVGEGVVPAYPLGRLFRDVQGKVNQTVAARADFTYLMVAGRAVEVGALATSAASAADRLQR